MKPDRRLDAGEAKESGIRRSRPKRKPMINQRENKEGNTAYLRGELLIEGLLASRKPAEEKASRLQKGGNIMKDSITRGRRAKLQTP